MNSSALPTNIATSSVNKKKLSQRLAKQNYKYKEFPLLNLYIIIITIMELIGEAFNIEWLRLIKPVPIILMIIYISGKNSQRDHLVPTLIRGGLFLSLIGDIFLMFSEISAFIIGTGFFLVAHILYIVAFTMGDQVRQLHSTGVCIRRVITFILISLFLINVYNLWDKFSHPMFFTSYAFTLLLMNLGSVYRYEKTTPYSFWFMTAGAVLFGLSDNLLGYLKFNKIGSDFGRAAVMLLYYSAQYLLMHGAMHHSNLQYQISRYLKATGSANLQSANIRVQTRSKAKNGSNARWEGNYDEQHND